MSFRLPRIYHWPSGAQFHVAAAVHYRSLAALYRREANEPAERAERQLMRSHALEAIRIAKVPVYFRRVRAATQSAPVDTGEHFSP